MRNLPAAGLLILLAIASMARNTLWEDDGAIWLDAVNKAPQKARGYNELGLHAVQVHNYAQAIEAFTQSLRLNPYMSNAYINIGLAYEGLNRPDMAIRTYENAIGMVPDDPTAYYNLGLVYYKQRNDREKALELFLKARDLNPLEPDVHQNLGCVYRDMGRGADALEEFRLYQMLK